jgi:hypothetical protein
MEHFQAKVFLEYVEVAIAMQKLMTRFYAEGRNEAVNCATNRDAQTAQLPVVSRRGDCQGVASSFVQCELTHDLQRV